MRYRVALLPEDSTTLTVHQVTSHSEINTSASGKSNCYGELFKSVLFSKLTK